MEPPFTKLHHLLRFLRPHWHWVVLAPFAMLLESYMDLLQPALMQRIVDEGVSAHDQALIFATGWRMLLYALLGALGGALCTYFSSKAAMGFGNDVRQAVFRAVQRLTFEQTDRFTAGSLTTRLTDDISVLQFLVMMLTRMLLRSPFLLIGSIILVLRTDWHLALPLLLSAPVITWIVIRWMSRLIPLFRERQLRNDRLSAKMQETLIGIRVVKAFATERGEARRFEGLNQAVAETGLEAGYLHATLWPALSLVQLLTVVVILFVAGFEADAGLIKAGQIAAIVNWVSQVMMALIHLSFQTMHFSRSFISARRVLEVLGTEPGIQDGPRSEAPADGGIEFRNVSFAYPGSSGQPVLKDLSFRIQPGTHVAIIGATGSGKTTLMNLIARFYEADGGEVLVGGAPVRTYALRALRGAMGIVLQNPRLFVGSIDENIRWGRADATDKEVAEAARIAQADRFIAQFPEHGATRIAQGGVSLSGGQKQRISIARALIRHPQILLLDDATSAVDPETERRLRQGIRRHFRGTTVLSVVQRVSSIQDNDTILVLDGGSIAGFGTHEELLRTCAPYREIIDSQTPGGKEVA